MTKDGLRVMVERLWLRGLTKDLAAVELWLKDVASSPELRKWFGNNPACWREFQNRHRREWRDKKGVVRLLKRKAKEETAGLVSFRLLLDRLAQNGEVGELRTEG